MSYLRSLSALEAAIRDTGGTTVIITSQTEEHFAAVRADAGNRGEAISDPRNEVAREMKSQRLVDVAISAKKGYKHGMAQPAVLVVKRDGTVLERWAIVPGVMSLGGAADRPDLGEIWQNVEAKLFDEAIVHSQYSSLTAMKLLREKVLGAGR